MSAATQNSKARTLRVTYGPGEADLLDAFKYAYDKDRPGFPVMFTASWENSSLLDFPVQAQVVGLTYDSGTRGMLILSLVLRIADRRGLQAVGFYDTRKRTGFFEPGHLGVVKQPMR